MFLYLTLFYLNLKKQDKHYWQNYETSGFKLLRESHLKFAAALNGLRNGGQLDGITVPPSPESAVPLARQPCRQVGRDGPKYYPVAPNGTKLGAALKDNKAAADSPDGVPDLALAVQAGTRICG